MKNKKITLSDIVISPLFILLGIACFYLAFFIGYVNLVLLAFPQYAETVSRFEIVPSLLRYIPLLGSLLGDLTELFMAKGSLVAIIAAIFLEIVGYALITTALENFTGKNGVFLRVIRALGNGLNIFQLVTLISLERVWFPVTPPSAAVSWIIRGSVGVLSLYCVKKYMLDVLLNKHQTDDTQEQPQANTPASKEQIAEWKAKADTACKEKKYKTALELYEKAANAGDLDSQIRSATFNAMGLGTKQDVDESKPGLTEQDFIGEIDFGKTLKFYAMAADQGSAEGQFGAGTMFLMERMRDADPQSIQIGLAQLINSADQGFVPAMNELGSLYDEGKIVTANKDEALGWSLKAAEAYDESGMIAPKAMHRCGCLYDDENNRFSDKKKAFYWYKRAMEEYDDQLSSLRCGEMLLAGEGTEKDLENALRCFAVASKDHDGEPVEPWAALIEQLQEESERSGEGEQDFLTGIDYFGLDSDRPLAFPCFKRSAEAGYMESMYLCGYMYENGIGTEVDLQEALHWYEKSALRGNPLAQVSYASMYREGKGTKEDLQKAVFWYECAAAQGNPSGMYWAALCYGLTGSISRFKQWMEKAAEQTKDLKVREDAQEALHLTDGDIQAL